MVVRVLHKTIIMSRNILELKSINIAPEMVQTLATAKRLAKLKDFELKEEYFEPVYHPADLVDNIDYYAKGEAYMDNVRVADIKGTLHPRSSIFMNCTGKRLSTVNWAG